MSEKRRISPFRKVLVLFIFAFVLLSYYPYQIIFTPNVHFDDREYQYFYVPTGATYKDVLDLMKRDKLVEDLVSFGFLAKIMDYDKKVKAGKFRVKKEMTNPDLIRMLRNGSQEPVRLTFNNLRRKKDVSNRLCRDLEASSSEFLQLMKDPEVVAKYGFDTFSISGMFIPNTYELYWNTTSLTLFEKMHKEYKRFWTEERLAKAKDIGLTPNEVSTLASIVEAEQKKRKDERPRIAGVYMNRLKKGIALQADPTLIYAHNDYTIKRVRKGHKDIVSPYNTYMYPGLPPGPINTPSINSIEAVLNYEEHNYYYFCASGKDGLHNFANSFEQHLINARNYQKLLNAANIE